MLNDLKDATIQAGLPWKHPEVRVIGEGQAYTWRYWHKSVTVRMSPATHKIFRKEWGEVSIVDMSSSAYVDAMRWLYGREESIQAEQ